MFIIDVTLKHTPVTFSVQRKSTEDAAAVYQDILTAMRSGGASVIELTCEQQPEKRVAILSNEISGVQLFEKSSTATASGRPPGFFMVAEP